MSTVEETKSRFRLGDVFYYTDSWGHRKMYGIWVAAVITITVGAFAVGAAYGIATLVRATGRASCNTFARQSGFSTKYRLMHFMDGGACFVRTPSGRWMTQDKVLVTLSK